jgi:DNA repair exonuclease SbcCD ATPase subunit
VRERATNIHRRLLEHRAGVLGAALAETERATRAQECRAADANGPLSSPGHKFDGAHLFAGHEDAVVPGGHSRGASQKELEALEARLAAADERAQEREAELENAQTAAAAELEDVRAAAAEELANARAASASELARARERAGELERRVATLERELESSVRGREDAAGLEVRIRTLERELLDAERKADGARTEAEAAAAAWAVEKASWASERQLFEKEKGRWVGLSGTLENQRQLWELEREELNAQAKDQIALAAEGLRDLVQRFDVPLFSRESGLAVLVDALGRYLEKHNAQESEQLLTAEVEKRNAMTRELEAAKAEIRALQTRSSVSAFSVFCRGQHRLDELLPFRRAAAFTWSPDLPRHSPLRRMRRASSRSCSHFGLRCRRPRLARHD